MQQQPHMRNGEAGVEQPGVGPNAPVYAYFEAPNQPSQQPLPPPRQVTPQPDLLMDLGTLFSMLWRGKGWMLLFALLFGLAAAGLWVVLPPKFDSTTSILIDPRGLKIVENDVTPGTTTSEANVAVIESQKRVMISDAVLRQVVQREGLATHPEYGAKQPGLVGQFKLALKQFTGGSVRRRDPELAALGELRKQVRTARVTGSFVIDLSVRSPDPDLSSRLANAIAATYIQSEFESRSELARRATLALTGRLDELRGRVQASEERVEAFKRDNGIIGFNGRLSAEQQLAEATTQLAAARVATNRARARFDQVSGLRATGAGPDAIAEAVQSATVRQLRARYAAASQTAGALSAQLRGRHPQLIAARAEVSDLDRQINGELSRIVRAAQYDLERAESEQARLEAERGRIMAAAMDTSGNLVQLRELEREADADRQVFRAFLVRAREIGEQQAVDTSVTRILSPAVPPISASSLSLKVLLVLGLVLGLGLGAVVALVRGAVLRRREVAA